MIVLLSTSLPSLIIKQACSLKKPRLNGPKLLGLAGSPIGFLLINFVMKPDVPANRLFAGLGVRWQDFQNLSPLISLRVGVVNQRICVGDNLNCVPTTRTANLDPGMKREPPNPEIPTVQPESISPPAPNPDPDARSKFQWQIFIRRTARFKAMYGN